MNDMENVMKIIAATMLVIATAAVATVDAQVPDFTPATPLIGALLHNDAAEAKRLLEHGADPNEGRFVGGCRRCSWPSSARTWSSCG